MDLTDSNERLEREMLYIYLLIYYLCIVSLDLMPWGPSALPFPVVVVVSLVRLSLVNKIYFNNC